MSELPPLRVTRPAPKVTSRVTVTHRCGHTGSSYASVHPSREYRIKSIHNATANELCPRCARRELQANYQPLPDDTDPFEGF